MKEQHATIDEEVYYKVPEEIEHAVNDLAWLAQNYIEISYKQYGIDSYNRETVHERRRVEDAAHHILRTVHYLVGRANGTIRTKTITRELDPDEVIKLQDRIVELETKILSGDEVKQKIADAEKRAELAEKAAETAKSTAKSAQELVASMRTQISNVESQRDRAQQRLGSMTLELDELKVEIAKQSQRIIKPGERKLQL